MEGWLARAEGWLARAGDLASQIFQNDGNSSQIFKKSFFIFYFLENLEKIHPIPPRASSGRLRPAQASSGQLGPAQASSGQLRPAWPGSFCSKNPRPSQDLKLLRNPSPAENQFKNDFPILSNRCHIWQVSNSLISTIYGFLAVRSFRALGYEYWRPHTGNHQHLAQLVAHS